VRHRISKRIKLNLRVEAFESQRDILPSSRGYLAVKFLYSIQKQFKPLFDADRREAIARLLRSMGVAVIVIGSVTLLLDILGGGLSFDARTNVVLGLLAAQFAIFGMLRLGYVSEAAMFAVISLWLAMTYHAWNVGGVRDMGVIVYILVILMASLLANWRVALFVSLASIASVWVLAFSEARGILVPDNGSPMSIARDLTAIFSFLVILVFLLVGVIRQALDAMRDDFDRRLKAEQSLREEEERFRKIFRASPVAISITSLEDGRLLDANEAYWNLTGFDAGSTLGRTTVDLKIWEDEDQRRNIVARLKDQTSLRNSAYEFINQSGEKRATIVYYDLMDVRGESAILSMYYDITDQKRVEQALKESEARARALLNAIPDMIFELKRDGTFLQYAASTGLKPILPPEEFLGKSIAQVLPSIAEQAAFAIERSLESGQVHAFEYPLVQDGQEKTFEARIVSIGADTVLAIIRDVSLIKWAVSEREKLIAELEAKNAELERFVYTVSHDLKSPIVTIVGFLAYLEDDLEKGNREQLKKDVERIYRAAYKMQELLRDLLELSRIGRVMDDAEEIPFANLVKDALELTEGRLHERGVRVVCMPDMPNVYGDRKRLLELLQTLIDNAAKYMGDQPDPIVEIGQRGVEGNKPIFHVRDNGMGIAPEYHEQIFGLFNKLDPNSEGTGIGLAIAKRIAEIHGCRIWVESESGNGSTFLFTLPAPGTPPTQPKLGMR